LEPTRVKPLSGALLFVRFLALPTNIRLGSKGMPGTNSQAYYNGIGLRMGYVARLINRDFNQTLVM